MPRGIVISGLENTRGAWQLHRKFAVHPNCSEASHARGQLAVSKHSLKLQEQKHKEKHIKSIESCILYLDFARRRLQMKQAGKVDHDKKMRFSLTYALLCARICFGHCFIFFRYSLLSSFQAEETKCNEGTGCRQ